MAKCLTAAVPQTGLNVYNYYYGGKKVRGHKRVMG